MKPVLSAIAVFVIGMMVFTPAQAVPVTFNTALPVSQGSVIWREQFIYKKSEDVAGQDQTAATISSVLGYGLTPDLAIFGIVPYTWRNLDVAAGDRGTDGLGDIRAFGRYTVYQNDFKGGTFRIAPFAGVEAPTGEDQERDNQGVLPVPLQPGSGTWDVFGGLIATWASVDYNIDTQVSYQNNGEDHGIERGDSIRADASIQYRVFPGELSGDVPGYVYALLESNFIYEDKMQVSGADNPNSGGSKLYLTPGLQYAAERWVGEAAVQIPVTQNLNGPNREDEYVMRAGFRINF